MELAHPTQHRAAAAPNNALAPAADRSIHQRRHKPLGHTVRRQSSVHILQVVGPAGRRHRPHQFDKTLLHPIVQQRWLPDGLQAGRAAALQRRNILLIDQQLQSKLRGVAPVKQVVPQLQPTRALRTRLTTAQLAQKTKRREAIQQHPADLPVRQPGRTLLTVGMQHTAPHQRRIAVAGQPDRRRSGRHRGERKTRQFFSQQRTQLADRQLPRVRRNFCSTLPGSPLFWGDTIRKQSLRRIERFGPKKQIAIQKRFAAAQPGSM